MITVYRAIFTIISILALLITPIAHVAALPAPASPVETMQAVNTSEIHIKFRESVHASLKNNRFESKSANDLAPINTLLSDSTVTKKDRLFSASASSIEEKRSHVAKRTGKSAPDLNSYFRLKLSAKSNPQQVLAKLQKSPFIAEAYFAPLPSPSPVSPDYTSKQTYLAQAPRGMGVSDVSGLAGVLGDNIQVTDIEYSWNTQHEDLSDSRQPDTLIANGTPSDPFNDTNHGTAVAGILSADHNTFGVDGIVPNAKLRFVNSYNTERGWDAQNAILLALANSSAGDVILIEQQTYGPSMEYLPVEWVPAVYDAIKLATDSGVIVVEAAGNGYANLDDPVYGSSFPLGKPDSGAIMVGAAYPACNAGTGNQSPRSRLPYSNYGTRVNVQGWGNDVATTGFGNASTPNATYTTTFSGTSSASALVAGAVSVISSHEEATTGQSLTSSAMRDLLITTGNSEDTRASSTHIGPAPNLPRALGVTTSVFSTPCLSATPTSNPSVELSWDNTIDNANAIFEIKRNGSVIDTVIGTTTYSDENVVTGAAYTYVITAQNADGSDRSDTSNSVSVFTADVTPPSAPANFVVTGKQASEITIGWTASSDNYGTVGYDIFRNGTKIGTTSALKYTDNGLSPSTSYSYYVIAYDAAGNRSAASPTISSTTLGDTSAPTAPTGLIASAPTVGQVTLQWNAATDNYGVAKYNIYRSGVLIGTSASPAYNDTSVSRKKSYTYQVKAVDWSGNISVGSNSVTIKTR